jgi:hypothetical protein
MSNTNFKPAGSGSGASLPFVSIDIPADATPAANAGAGVARSERNVAARVLSVDIPDVPGAASAGPNAIGSGSDAPLPFVSIDIPADVS